jgi:hypothetical protein
MLVSTGSLSHLCNLLAGVRPVIGASSLVTVPLHVEEAARIISIFRASNNHIHQQVGSDQQLGAAG